MLTTEASMIALGGQLIELLAAIVVAYHAGWALLLILKGRGSREARRVIGEGVLAALGFSVAGTLLKTIALQSWPQIRNFAFIFLLRTLLKRVFQWESRSLGESRSLTLHPVQVAGPPV